MISLTKTLDVINKTIAVAEDEWIYKGFDGFDKISDLHHHTWFWQKQGLKIAEALKDDLADTELLSFKDGEVIEDYILNMSSVVIPMPEKIKDKKVFDLEGLCLEVAEDKNVLFQLALANFLLSEKTAFIQLLACVKETDLWKSGKVYLALLALYRVSESYECLRGFYEALLIQKEEKEEEE